RSMLSRFRMPPSACEGPEFRASPAPARPKSSPRPRTRRGLCRMPPWERDPRARSRSKESSRTAARRTRSASASPMPWCSTCVDERVVLKKRILAPYRSEARRAEAGDRALGAAVEGEVGEDRADDRRELEAVAAEAGGDRDLRRARVEIDHEV